MTESRAIEIPWARLSKDQQSALVESFILREGTDYGRHEHAHETKVEQLLKALKSGRAHVIFDLDSQTFTILSAETWQKRGASS